MCIPVKIKSRHDRISAISRITIYFVFFFFFCAYLLRRNLSGREEQEKGVAGVEEWAASWDTFSNARPFAGRETIKNNNQPLGGARSSRTYIAFNNVCTHLYPLQYLIVNTESRRRDWVERRSVFSLSLPLISAHIARAAASVWASIRFRDFGSGRPPRWTPAPTRRLIAVLSFRTRR